MSKKNSLRKSKEVLNLSSERMNVRKILFKAKRKDNHKWVYGDLMQLHDGKKYIVNNEMGFYLDEDGNLIKDQISFVNEVIPKTISEFTGLYDRNGKKIFENDICKGNGIIKLNDNAIVKYGKYKTEIWKEEYPCNVYQFGWYVEFINSKTQVDLIKPNGIKVVGNIFDRT